MHPIVETANILVGTGGLLLLLVAACLYADILFFRKQVFGELVLRWGLLLAAVLPVAALVLALFYSEYLGFVPCGLCWTMRIFVFSQAFIMPIAYLTRDTGVALYGIVLSIPGILVGVYQHYLQMGGGELLPCPAAGGDCSKRILFEYGFITFPLVGTAMLLCLLAIYIYLYTQSKNT